MPREDESTLKAILGFIRCRPEHLDQKLIFLDSLRTFCVDPTLQGVLHFFQEEVIMTIQWLLQEEPIDCLDTAVRQQAMLATATMSRARLLQQDKYSILQACFKSVFSLPPQHSRGSAAFLYSKTLSAMDSMLQALVCSAGTLGGVELQNILKVLLPYTCSQLPEVQKRAMAQIARLLNFINNSSGLEICPCFAQRKILRHECPKIQKFGLLGKLVGQLTLSCTCKDKETSCEAAEALYELHIFVLQQTSKVEWMDYSGQLQPLVGSQKQSWMFFREYRARRLFSVSSAHGSWPGCQCG
ncbi:maestro heat-like repeat-containing protein family member 7 [Dryobates pubescens]|uniref:maestro heat-like repeat-containing protein family member 7 n=1 Tax=Dryobates pubescens TaxID=118200 RepID=UPI0023B8B87F|nr:maestro heat-like repeat-containing protein family member 7 [Dryobates pubescens]